MVGYMDPIMLITRGKARGQGVAMAPWILKFSINNSILVWENYKLHENLLIGPLETFPSSPLPITKSILTHETEIEPQSHSSK
jgi:hypothetical protein